jgi:hypothetical protein
MGMTQERLLTRVDAALFLGIQPRTLDQWAWLGIPKLKFTKVGRLAKYRQRDLEEFVESRSGVSSRQIKRKIKRQK